MQTNTFQLGWNTIYKHSFLRIKYDLSDSDVYGHFVIFS